MVEEPDHNRQVVQSWLSQAETATRDPAAGTRMPRHGRQVIRQDSDIFRELVCHRFRRIRQRSTGIARTGRSVPSAVVNSRSMESVYHAIWAAMNLLPLSKQDTLPVQGTASGITTCFCDAADFNHRG